MASAEDKRAREMNHRLHYRWSQLEADRCGVNIGSPIHPLPTANRILELDPNCKYEDDEWPVASSEDPEELAKFSKCAGVYKTMDYNTFSKSGCLKLSEIEMYFMDTMLTKQSIGEWVLVYLGIGTGERFRWLRDEFYPGLAVVAFDPLEGQYTGDREKVVKAVEKWNNDGTDFTFLLKCFDAEKDSAWISEKYPGKKIILISDIRGIAFADGDKDGDNFDKEADNKLQWAAIQKLRPEKSLMKFSCPRPYEQFYEYAPGTILKQIFCFYHTKEVRLMIDGVPKEKRKYNCWEIYDKMMFHHEHLRGQVYACERRADSTRALDNCFDCTVLWDTISSHALKNEQDPYRMLGLFVKFHVYSPSDESWSYTWKPPTRKQRWTDVREFIRTGRLTEAIAALEAEGEEDAPDTDWADIVHAIDDLQPHLYKRLKLVLHRPCKRSDLITALGSLSDPFVFLGNELDLLHEEERHALQEAEAEAEPPAKRQCTVWNSRFADLTEAQQKAAIELGWTEADWNSNKFHLPRKDAWETLSEDMKKNLGELGESASTWDNWRLNTWGKNTWNSEA